MGSCLSLVCPSWSSHSRSSSDASVQTATPPLLTVERSATSQEEPAIMDVTMTNTSSEPPNGRKTTGFVNAVYCPSWRAYDGQTPASLNLDSVSHVFYAFAKLDADGSVALSDKRTDYELPVDSTNGCIHAFQKLRREKYPVLRLILSIGGGAYSKSFNEITADLNRLERLVHSARTLVEDLGMDGIDIDWEYPSSKEQGEQYISLLARLRHAMAPPQYLVTTAVPGAVWALRNMNLGEASNYVDMINVMAYDFVGPFPGTSKSGHHAQLRCPARSEDHVIEAEMSGEAAIRFLLEQGVAREKLVLGVPLYGRSFLGATGPEQTFNGHGGHEDGIFEFRHLPIRDRHQGSGNDPDDVDAITPCAEQFDSKRVAAWCVGPQTKEGGGFITYDNATSVEAKAHFVKEEGLGGMFYWHIGFDKPKNGGSLVDVGGDVLRVGQKRTSWWALHP